MASSSSGRCHPTAGTCDCWSRLNMNEDARRIRVLVVDDHDVVQWGFRLLLERQPWVERCIAARDADEALAMVREVKPQVALVDLFLGRHSGAEICNEMRATSPQTKILLISGAGRISPAAARAAGASGFVSKDRGAPPLPGGVRTGRAGGGG